MKEFKTITRATQRLIDGVEGTDVDWKRDVRGVESSDLVAFANSDDGGVILVGVDEDRTSGALRRAVIHGCDGDERERDIIQNRAADCTPPVAVELTLENTRTDKPIWRIDIPSSKHRPHCTKRGTYKVRSGSRTHPLDPERLLAMLLKSEEAEFVERFRSASDELMERIDQVGQSIDTTQRSIGDGIENLFYSLGREMTDRFERIDGLVDDVRDGLDDVMTTTGEESEHYFRQLNDEVEVLAGEVSLLRHGQIQLLTSHGLDTPDRDRLRANIKRYAKGMLAGGTSVEAVEDVMIKEADASSEIAEWVREAIEEWRSEGSVTH